MIETGVYRLPDRHSKSLARKTAFPFRAFFFGGVPEPIGSCRPPRDDEITDRDLYRLTVLILRRRPHLDLSLRRTGLRRPYLENFALQVQLIPGPYRPRPAELVEPRADDPARGFELALHQEPHGHCGGVPAARRQPPEYRAARGLFVEMEGLRVEFGGEGLDPFLVDAQASGAEGLSDCEVFEI